MHSRRLLRLTKLGRDGFGFTDVVPLLDGGIVLEGMPVVFAGQVCCLRVECDVDGGNFLALFVGGSL